MTATRRCLAVLLCLTAAPAWGAHVVQESFGCKSLADAARLRSLQQGADQGVYRDSLGKLLGLGECRLWRPGEPVTRRDEDDGLACLSPKGSSLCYWSETSVIE